MIDIIVLNSAITFPAKHHCNTIPSKSDPSESFIDLQESIVNRIEGLCDEQMVSEVPDDRKRIRHKPGVVEIIGHVAYSRNPIEGAALQQFKPRTSNIKC